MLVKFIAKYRQVLIEVLVRTDGSVILWDIRDLNQKEHKTLRVNIEFDHASYVAWSPDSKAFIVHTVRENNIVVYKIEKKRDGAIGSAVPVITFEKVGKCSVFCV